jgi:hypothetical protein
MNRSFFAIASAALVAGSFAASADAALSYVRSANFGSFTAWTAYSSLEDMAANVNGTSAGSSSSIRATDGVWTDGTYVYKTTANAQGVAGSYNNLYVRYSSLSALNSNTGGTTYSMTQGMYYNEDVVANTTNGWTFRTASFGGSNNVGMYAFNNFTDLLSNSYFYASGFTTGDQNGDNKYWAGTGGTCWRSNFSGGSVNGFSVFASGPDLYNNVPSQTISSSAGYGADARFMTIESSLIPAPGALALLAVAGVGATRRRRA